MDKSQEKLIGIASQFIPSNEIIEIKPSGEGFINNTYFVSTTQNSPHYILQRKNKTIFRNIPEMMKNIEKVTHFIKDKIIESGGDPHKEVLQVITTNTGELYFEDEEKEFWVMTVYIPDTITYEKATDTSLARKGGEGIGKFLNLLSDFSEPLYPTLKGFHDLSFRFKQWEECKSKNLSGRKEKISEEIVWVESRIPKMMEFWRNVEEGRLPKRVTHNDTKLSNILFDKNGNVQCVIDLDTVMLNTALADFGDAIRSFANSGAEDDRDLDNVNLDLDMFEAYAEGYLSQTKDILIDTEIEYLPFAPLYITYEQVVRFLMDYIYGDIYYKISYPEHNLVRTRAQMKLLESMEENYDKMQEIIQHLIKK